MPDECVAEMKYATPGIQTLLTAETHEIIPVLRCEDFSTLRRLIRVTDHVIAFIDVKLKTSHHLNINCNPEGDSSRAEAYWVRINQQQLVSNKDFPVWKHKFGLFLDDHGMWRCKGRLSNAKIPEMAKFPILLSSKHHYTDLVVRDCHVKVMHVGLKETLTELRSRYWLIKGRQYIRRVLHNCIICKRFTSKPYVAPPPPPLPPVRVQEAPPFAHVGIDFAGPLYIKDGNKVWICLYTCCVTRAVHLEVVPNMTTEAYLRSFKRFAARRGFPNRVFSDNGKTFKAAQRALVKLVAQPSVTQYFSDTHIKWTFNLEKAPWWGGMFERLVKSMKQCLKRVVGGAKLTLDELQTVVTEAEATLNSRPLSYVSTEDLDEPLTPSHLIVGRRLFSYPDPFVDDARDPDYEMSSAALTRRMQYLNTILNHFWVRWRREYLLELRETHRYAHVQNSPNTISVGDVVLVYDEDLPRTLWKTAVVEDLIQGNDGLVRGAHIRVKSGADKLSTLQRPVQLLYPLEINCDKIPVHVATTTDVTDNGSYAQQERPRRDAAVAARTRILELTSQHLSTEGEDV